MHKENLVSLFYKRVDLTNRLKKEKKEKKKRTIRFGRSGSIIYTIQTSMNQYV